MAVGIGWLTTQNASFLRIPGKFQVNNTTGNIRYYSNDNKLLFESDGNSYDIKRAYYDKVRQYNSKLPGSVRSGVLTDEEIRRDFFLIRYKASNYVRKTALNDPNSYPTYEFYENNAKAFAAIGIAGVENPVSRISTSTSTTQTGPNTPRPKVPTKVPPPASKVNPGAVPGINENPGGAIDPNNPDGSNFTDPGLTPYYTNVDGIGKYTNYAFQGGVTGQGGAANLYFNGDKAGIDKGLNFWEKLKPAAPVPVFRYPKADLSVGKEYGITYDYIKIRCVDYIASLNKTDFNPTGAPGGKLEEFQQTTSGINDLTKLNPSEAYLRNQRTIGYVILPMQPNLSTQNSTGWGEDSANLLQLVTASLANNFLSDDQTIFNMDNIRKHLSTAYQSFKGIANDAIASRQQIAALLAGYVTSTNVLQRTTGTVINPNMEMLFNGPKLRSFNFTFDMAPRFREEANEIRKMIRFFKKYMAPEKDGTRAFLKAPKIFLLDYIYNGDLGRSELEADWLANEKEHPFLNRFKPCALTNFSVNYTPAGSYMTYRDGGSMTQYQLSFTFSEIEPIYQNDFGGDDNNPADAGF